MKGVKHPPEVQPETTEEEEMADQEECTALLRKKSHQRAQSSISSTDRDEVFSANSDGFKSVIPDEPHQDQEQIQGTGFTESSRLEIHEIEDVTAVAKPPYKGEIEEEASNKEVELRTENGIEVEDLYLERIYEKPSSHNFYCPNCKACITKVFIRDSEWVKNNVSEPISTADDRFRCTSCLSFLTPIGAWLFPKLASSDPEQKVSFEPGDNVKNIWIRESETFEVSQETRDRQESPVDRPHAVTDKNEADLAITEKLLLEPEIHTKDDWASCFVSFEELIVETATDTLDDKKDSDSVAGQSDSDSGTGQSDSDSGDGQSDSDSGAGQSDSDSGADQTRKIDCAVSNSNPTHPSLNTTVLEEEDVPNNVVGGKQVVPDQSDSDSSDSIARQLDSDSGVDQTRKIGCAVSNSDSSLPSLSTIISEEEDVPNNVVGGKQVVLDQSDSDSSDSIAGQLDSDSGIDQTRKIDCAVSNSDPTHPSLNTTISEEEDVLDQGVGGKKVVPDQSDSDSNDSIAHQLDSDSRVNQTQKIGCAVSNSDPTHPSLNTTISEEEDVLDQGVGGKQVVSDQSDSDSSDSSDSIARQLDSDSGADQTRKIDKGVGGKQGSTVENVVLGTPYVPYESNESVLDVVNQTSTVNKPQIQNQSNKFSLSLVPKIDTKVSWRSSLNSIKAMIVETVTDILDDKKDRDIENAAVGVPYPSPGPKWGFLDRFSLPAWLNKAPVLSENPKIPEPIEATVPDGPPVSPSIERVPDGSVSSREGPVALPFDGQAEPEPSRYNRWEIVKSIVYGGLAESITSLGIVASAASANTATGNIVVLATANLISGLFILFHSLIELKSELFRRTSNESDEREHVDRYEVVLGNRENYILHFTVVIFSFVIFGLVPPLVYGFSFPNSNNKDLKLAAVVGVSLLCIILLSIGKAYIQRENRWDVYVKTVAFYVAIAAGAGGFSYLAGDLLHKVIKNYGWFEESSAFNLRLPLPETSLAKPAWESF